jgi:hypothetical protein
LTGSLLPGQPKVRTSVDLDLMIEAARLVVTTRLASTLLLVRQLHVTAIVADALLGRLEHYEVIAPPEAGKPRRVITTPGQLSGVIATLERQS